MFSPLLVLLAVLPASIIAQSLASGSSSFSTPPSISISLLSTNPTAVPLSRIGASEASSSTLAPGWTTTPAAGSVVSSIPGAPALPNLNTISPSKYPALDKTPDTNSPEVQQWIRDIAASGVQIPVINQTVLGGCAANPAAATDTARCWWTCGGCTRPTDVTTCPNKFTWGLTYDDGPAPYTPNLIQFLNQNNLKTTFFVVGSRAISFPGVLQIEYMAQNQIAVHTWSHPYLTTLTNEQIIAELGWTKKIIKDVLGVTPNMMRPPYGDIDDRVRAISLAMGLTPVMWTRLSPMAAFDTGDFNIHAGTITPSQVLQNWEYILGNASTLSTGFIVLEHDLFQQSVEIATGYILPDALAHTNPKYNIQPVINCLNKPLQDAYIETNQNSSNPLPTLTGYSVPASPLSVSGQVSTSSSGSQATPSRAVTSSAGQLNYNFIRCVVTCIAVGVTSVLF